MYDSAETIWWFVDGPDVNRNNGILTCCSFMSMPCPPHPLLGILPCRLQLSTYLSQYYFTCWGFPFMLWILNPYHPLVKIIFLISHLNLLLVTYSTMHPSQVSFPPKLTTPNGSIFRHGNHFLVLATATCIPYIMNPHLSCSVHAVLKLWPSFDSSITSRIPFLA